MAFRAVATLDKVLRGGPTGVGDTQPAAVVAIHGWNPTIAARRRKWGRGVNEGDQRQTLTGIGEVHYIEIRLMEIHGYVVDAKPTRQVQARRGTMVATTGSSRRSNGSPTRLWQGCDAIRVCVAVVGIGP